MSVEKDGTLAHEPERVVAQAGHEHTPSNADFFGVVHAIRDTANQHACCTVHAAHASIVNALMALMTAHGDNPDTIERELRRLCNLTMNNLRAGVIVLTRKS